MIRINNAEVVLTEQTVKELLKAIEKAKEETEFITETKKERNKAFESDMSHEAFVLAQRKRGTIKVKSEYSKVSFEIHLEVKPQTQESLGYKLV